MIENTEEALRSTKDSILRHLLVIYVRRLVTNFLSSLAYLDTWTLIN